MTVFAETPISTLVEHALAKGEGKLLQSGALSVSTGKRTGRSPADRFIVVDDMTRNDVEWNQQNRKIEDSVFEKLWDKVDAWLGDRDHYQINLHAGSDPELYEPLDVRTETAWHNIFAQNIFVRPKQYNPKAKQAWQYMNCPSFVCDPALDGTNSDGVVAINFERKKVLIAGIGYAGEMKKSAFSFLNFLMPAKDVLPMHASANISREGKVTIFFGLSGTGKTTLSADPASDLIGDDEHGWGPDGVFNFEGGCYAKCINLSREQEPMIYDAIRHGTIVENVVSDEHGVPNYADSSITENTRCCYPREYIDNAVEANRAGHPSGVVFLTCDLNGVLPPVSILDPDAASYHFLSGYTAVVGGTEVGAEIKPTFSTCFGAPFFPRAASVYANLLREKIESHKCPVYLVNTGWIGGPYGEGHRISLKLTRQIISEIQEGKLHKVERERIDQLNLEVPVGMNIDKDILIPRLAWDDPEQYDQRLNELAAMFQENFAKYDVDERIKLAGPKVK